MDDKDTMSQEPESSLTTLDQSADNETEEVLPPGVSELLEGVPPEHRSRIVGAFSSITQFAAPVFNPVLQRITTDHITQLIRNDATRSEREAAEEAGRRRYHFGYFLVLSQS